MNEKELRELFCDMQMKGLSPLICDTKVPLYETAIPCGIPTAGYDDCVDSVLLPKELLSMHPEFMIPVKGDSMIGANIESGDMVKVVTGVALHDADIVLASIDGDYTLKAYMTDGNGRVWLVPQNEAYTPIMLEEDSLAMIVGKVVEVVKRAPRVNFHDCLAAIRRAQMGRAESHEIAPQTVSAAIREVAPMIKMARQWYAVYRVLADHNVVGEHDFASFVELVAAEVPTHDKQPKCEEMQRMASLSFAKHVRLWRADNAPVTGQRFVYYLKIAHRMQEMLGVH